MATTNELEKIADDLAQLADDLRSLKNALMGNWLTSDQALEHLPIDTHDTLYKVPRAVIRTKRAGRRNLYLKKDVLNYAERRQQYELGNLK